MKRDTIGRMLLEFEKRVRVRERHIFQKSFNLICIIIFGRTSVDSIAVNSDHETNRIYPLILDCDYI